MEFEDNNIQRITVTDVTSKTIIKLDEVNQNQTIDLSSYASGVYIVSIQTDKENFSSKIIKH